MSTNCRFIWLYVYKLLCLLSHLHFLFDVLTVFIFPRSKTNSQWNCKTLYILFWQCDSRLLIHLHFLIFWICAYSALVKKQTNKKTKTQAKALQYDKRVQSSVERGMSPDNFSLLRVITIPLWAQKGISQWRDCGSISATWPTLFFCKRLHQQIWIYGLKDMFQTNPQPYRMQAIEQYPSLLLVSLQILSSWNKIHPYGGKLQILFTYLHILQSVKQEQELVKRCFLKKK